MTAGQIIQKLSYPDMYVTSPNSYSSHVLQCTCHVGMERHSLRADEIKLWLIRLRNSAKILVLDFQLCTQI